MPNNPRSRNSPGRTGAIATPSAETKKSICSLSTHTLDASNAGQVSGPRRQSRRPAGQCPKTRRGPQGRSPRGPLPAPIEKRPPRARRPALPQPRAAVLSAKAGLTAGFGMGPGDPRLCGRARGGRSPAASLWSLPGTPVRGDPGGRMAGTEEDHASRSVL